VCLPQIEKIHECLFQPRAHLALVVGPEGNAKRLKALAIVMLEYGGHQEWRRVFVKIGRQIGYAQSVMAVMLTPIERGGRRRIRIPHQNSSTLQLVVQRIRNCQMTKWMN